MRFALKYLVLLFVALISIESVAQHHQESHFKIVDSLAFMAKDYETANAYVATQLKDATNKNEQKLLESLHDYIDASALISQYKFPEAAKILEKILTYRDYFNDNTPYLIALYNEYLVSLVYSKNMSKANDIVLELDTSFLNNTPQSQAEANLNYSLAVIFNRNKNFYEAILRTNNTITWYEENDPKNYVVLGEMYNNCAVLYGKVGAFREEMAYHLKANNTIKKIKGAPKKNILAGFNNLVSAYISYGDKEKAESLLRDLDSVVAVWTNSLDASHRYNQQELSSHIYNLYKHKLRLQYGVGFHDKERAFHHYNSLQHAYYSAHIDAKKRFENIYASALIILAGENSFFETKQELALQENLLREALKVSRKANDYFYTYNAFFNLAQVALQQKKYDVALINVDEALGVLGKDFYIDLLNMQANMLKAEILFSSGEDSLARLHIKKVYAPILKEKTTVASLSREDFKDKTDKRFIEILLKTAKLYRHFYENYNKEDDAYMALHFYKLAAALFETYYLKERYNTQLADYNRKINQGIFKMHLLLDLPLESQLVNLLENNTSQHLRKEFEQKQLQNLAIPDSVLTQRTILQGEQKYYTDKLESKDSIESQLKMIEIATKLQKLDSIVERINPSYLSFFEEEYKVADIQSKLKEGQVMLKYISGEDNLFALTIDKDTINLFLLGDKQTIFDDIEAFYHAIQTRNTEYLGYAKSLYTYLIAPMKSLLAYKKELIIIPQDKLNYVPFETLVTNDGTPLIYSMAISYTHSIQLWSLQTKTLPYTNKKEMLVAFAPQYTSSSLATAETDDIEFRGGNRLLDLQGATREAERVTKMLSGELYKNDKATKVNFANSTTKYQIYHLAMHSLLNEDNYEQSNLVFQNQQPLYYSELYRMHFPASLVVLSACNTGIGSLREGEGLMSLSRALTYSGVRSSVYSLWQVPDEETSEIMVSFYSYLKEGKAKDEALALAKRDFLKNNPLKTHPFFWAGFVINGDNTALQTQEPYKQYIFYACCVLLLFSVVVSIRKFV